MGITSSSLDFENAILDSQQTNIESPTSKVEDQNVLFSLWFFIKSVGNSSGSWLIDDT